MPAEKVKQTNTHMSTAGYRAAMSKLFSAIALLSCVWHHTRAPTTKHRVAHIQHTSVHRHDSALANNDMSNAVGAQDRTCDTALRSFRRARMGKSTRSRNSGPMWGATVFTSIVVIRLDPTYAYHLRVKPSKSPWVCHGNTLVVRPMLEDGPRPVRRGKSERCAVDPAPRTGPSLGWAAGGRREAWRS